MFIIRVTLYFLACAPEGAYATQWCRLGYWVFTKRILDQSKLNDQKSKKKNHPLLLIISGGKLDLYLLVQVKLCQKLLFLHQLTQNMTTDCSLNYKFMTWDFQAQTWIENVCTEIVSDIQNNFCTQNVLPRFCKKKSFWQRFTCTLRAMAINPNPDIYYKGITKYVKCGSWSNLRL